MIKYFFCFLWLLSPLHGFELKERLPLAKEGDFIVYAHKDHCTLLRIAKTTQEKLVIEEVSAPLSVVKDSWKEWFDRRAPGHTSWTKTTLALPSCHVLSQVSVDDSQIYATDRTFLPTLLSLPLFAIPKDARKKIGPEPQPGEVDNRRFWYPKIIFNNQERTVQVGAYQVRWPQDESELSGKPVELYIPQSDALTYLPYWIEVYSGPLKLKIYALDSGNNLSTE